MCPLELMDFVALPSNVKALEALKDFVEQRSKFVVLHGPSGWGKTHLLESTAKSIGKHHTISCPVFESKTFIQKSSGPKLTKWLILDHIQEVSKMPGDLQAIRNVLEKRLRLSQPTLLAVTGELESDKINSILGNREWVKVKVDEALPSEKFVLIRAKSEQLCVNLSDDLVRLLADLPIFNARSLIGAIHRLDISKSHWTELSDILLALGILQPQLANSAFGDLRDRINHSLAGENCEIKPQVSTKELMFVFIRICGLSEHSTASYFSTEPGTVYKNVKYVDQKRSQDPTRINSLINHLVNDLILK